MSYSNASSPQEDNFPYSEEVYSKGLDREDTLEGQIRSIINYYSRMEWHNFEYSLKALYPLLPVKLVEEYGLVPLKHDVSVTGVENHYQEFVRLQTLIETKTNMTWKKRFVKTFE